VHVRALACCAAIALAASAAAAHADDDDDDEDATFVALPKRSIGLRLSGRGTRIGGRSETGFGPTLELAFGTGRWQYFVEGGIASAGVLMPDRRQRVRVRIWPCALRQREHGHEHHHGDHGPFRQTHDRVSAASHVPPCVHVPMRGSTRSAR
jgi:hypothetical protein